MERKKNAEYYQKAIDNSSGVVRVVLDDIIRSEINSENALDLGTKFISGLCSFQCATRDYWLAKNGNVNDSYYRANATVIDLTTIINDLKIGRNQDMKLFIAGVAGDILAAHPKISNKLLEVASAIPEFSPFVSKD